MILNTTLQPFLLLVAAAMLLGTIRSARFSLAAAVAIIFLLAGAAWAESAPAEFLSVSSNGDVAKLAPPGNLRIIRRHQDRAMNFVSLEVKNGPGETPCQSALVVTNHHPKVPVAVVVAVQSAQWEDGNVPLEEERTVAIRVDPRTRFSVHVRAQDGRDLCDLSGRVVDADWIR